MTTYGFWNPPGRDLEECAGWTARGLNQIAALPTTAGFGSAMRLDDTPERPPMQWGAYCCPSCGWALSDAPAGVVISCPRCNRGRQAPQKPAGASDSAWPGMSPQEWSAGLIRSSAKRRAEARARLIRERALAALDRAETALLAEPRFTIRIADAFGIPAADFDARQVLLVEPGETISFPAGPEAIEGQRMEIGDFLFEMRGGFWYAVGGKLKGWRSAAAARQAIAATLAMAKIKGECSRAYDGDRMELGGVLYEFHKDGGTVEIGGDTFPSGQWLPVDLPAGGCGVSFNRFNEAGEVIGSSVNVTTAESAAVRCQTELLALRDEIKPRDYAPKLVTE